MVGERGRDHRRLYPSAWAERSRGQLPLQRLSVGHRRAYVRTNDALAIDDARRIWCGA
jgi:hypothetical protein